MKNREKGFAISGILLASLILFLALLLGILSVMASRKIVLDKEKNEIINELDDVDNPNCNIQICNVDTSGASTPEIANGMIPIKWDGVKWIKADVHNREGNNQWYDYNKQQWANVALVSELTRSIYSNASVGIEVNENDITAYLVWIPRYKYQLFNVSSESVSVQKINVIFENRNVTKSLGSTNGSYLTHPAFTFGDNELNGLWVGKFETTGTDTFPTIKPNSLSLTNQNINNQFLTSRLFNNTELYGLSVENDAHMMKNMEWGAVAYLSQSDYGKYGNPIYTGVEGLEKEIYINNVNSDINTGNGPGVTGCAGDSLNADMVRSITCPAGYAYYTINGVKASTTGNIYGIYDMNGGSWEYTVGGMYNSDDTTIMIANSGFDQSNIDNVDMEKYINKYIYGTSYNDHNAYNRRQLGDATGEVRGWNGDSMLFVNTSYPWFPRGGYYNGGTASGIFGFNHRTGAMGDNGTFRVVILG